MWEARAAPDRFDALVAWVREHADPAATIYAGADGPPRVVVIDPSNRGLAGVPDDLMARPAQQWTFREIPR